MTVEKRTPAAWVEYLGREHAELTLTEYMAACLSRLLGAQHEATQAAVHTESMVGALDDFVSELAARQALPYARSGAERLILARERDRAMRAALRQNGDTEP